MARAWPKLKLLVLTPPRIPVPRRVTLGGLRSIVYLCPTIHTLGIPFDATVVPAEDTTLAKPNASLVLLKVGYGPISDSSAVANFFFGIFPNLAHIDPKEVNWDESETHITRIERWKDVQDQVLEMRMGRAESL
jgi:hypothetical protein